jgi:hypothetical protein
LRHSQSGVGQGLTASGRERGDTHAQVAGDPALQSAVFTADGQGQGAFGQDRRPPHIALVHPFGLFEQGAGLGIRVGLGRQRAAQDTADENQQAGD